MTMLWPLRVCNYAILNVAIVAGAFFISRSFERGPVGDEPTFAPESAASYICAVVVCAAHVWAVAVACSAARLIKYTSDNDGDVLKLQQRAEKTGVAILIVFGISVAACTVGEMSKPKFICDSETALAAKASAVSVIQAIEEFRRSAGRYPYILEELGAIASPPVYREWQYSRTDNGDGFTLAFKNHVLLKQCRYSSICGCWKEWHYASHGEWSLTEP